jgi:hypothetical protein
MKNDINKLQKSLQIKEAISQGFFDGRFSNKVVPNKKALKSKKMGRKKVNVSDY